jgi:hypothetical protein
MAIRIEQPISTAFVGDIFRAVGKQDVRVDTVPIPVLAAGELHEIVLAESFRRRHRVFLFS